MSAVQGLFVQLPSDLQWCPGYSDGDGGDDNGDTNDNGDAMIMIMILPFI